MAARKALLVTEKSFDGRDHIAQHAKAICDTLASAFRLATGRRCAVCIKVLDQSLERENSLADLSVSTLCRDETSEDRSPREAEVRHWVTANTAFVYPFRSAYPDAFFSNDLQSLANYANTSFQVWNAPRSTRSRWLRWLPGGWPLPYRSTIVAPILPLDSTSPIKSLLGYLAVDSPARHAFAQRYDVDWLGTFSRLLHPMMKLWRDFDSQERR
jgi:hypothetical protein